MSDVEIKNTPSMPTPSRDYLPHLVVYIVWHPRNLGGRDLARALYADLAGDPDDPTSEGVGVPLYYRTGTPGAAVPAPVPLAKAQHTAVVVLIDDLMVVDRDKGWRKYVTDLVGEVGDDNARHRVLPVAMTKNAFNFDPEIRETNFIRFYEADPEKQADQLGIHVTHELCRQIMREPRADHGTSSGAALSDRVEVFISHAKFDGKELAEAVRNHIRSDQQLYTFFDSNDIYFGKPFRKLIEAGVRRAAMLVVNTDAYGQSEFCRDEVFLAKAEKRPIYILDATKKRVQRTFPYMYNSPSERCPTKDQLDFRPVIKGLLLEVLRIENFQGQFKASSGLFKVPKGQGIKVLPYPPELLTLADLRIGGNTDKIFVYPDPPLSVLEIKKLDVFAKDFVLTTPVLLLTQAQRQADLNYEQNSGAIPPQEPSRPSDEEVKSLVVASAAIVVPTRQNGGWMVGLSISDQPEPDLLRLGFGPEHVSDASTDFALFLLAAQYRLAYGGDLRKKGFTEKLHELVVRYNTKNFGPKQVLWNYLAWYIPLLTPVADRARFAAGSQEVDVEPPADLNIAEPETPPDTNSPDFPYVRARCLTAMRERMNQDTKARVVLGGKTVGFTGTYPGLVEEVDIAISSRKPLYLVGGFGGCAGVIIDAIKGKNPAELTQAYQEQSKGNPGYADFIKAFNERAAASGKDAEGQPLVKPIDYQALIARFGGYGVAGLSAANGLSPEENETLFTTIDVKEMIYLVLKGLLDVRSADHLGEA